MLVSECRVFQYIRVHLYPAFYQKTFETFNSASDQRLKVFLIHTQNPSEKHTLWRHLTWFPGITPPQNAMSVQHCPRATLRLIFRFSTVVVGGMEFRGISTTVVTPPETAALVPVQKPSQSVRPGSFK